MDLINLILTDKDNSSALISCSRAHLAAFKYKWTREYAAKTLEVKAD